MNEEIKIITLGDIFKNLETEEKAFKFKDYITNLQEENEKNKEYSEFYKDMSNKWKDMSDVFKKSCKDYKSRIDKAIEYINNLEKDYDVNVWQEDKHWAYILYVLQGENNIKGE